MLTLRNIHHKLTAKGLIIGVIIKRKVKKTRLLKRTMIIVKIVKKIKVG